MIVAFCESEVDGRFGAFVQFALDAFVLSHATLLKIAHDTFQFQELLGTDRIARLFDMFPVGKLSAFAFAFAIAIVCMPIAVSSHGRIALTMVILELTLTTDHSLLELGCLTCARRLRRVSDGVALLTRMKQTVGTLLSMTNYVAELAEVRAVPGEIVTAMSADHR